MLSNARALASHLHAPLSPFACLDRLRARLTVARPIALGLCVTPSNYWTLNRDTGAYIHECHTLIDL